MDLCEEKEDDVQPSKVSLSVEHGSQTKAKSPVQQERPDSPVPSGVSMKSDHSITEPLTFRDRNPSTEQRVQQERPDSPVPSGVSMKSNHSIAEPLTFRDRNHSTEQRAGMIGVRCASSNRPGGGGGKPDEEDRLTVATRARQKVFQ